MDDKEKILAEFKERLGYAANAKFALRQLEGVLATMPSKKEIAKGVILDCCKVLDAYPDSVTVDVVLIMLDKES